MVTRNEAKDFFSNLESKITLIKKSKKELSKKLLMNLIQELLLLDRANSLKINPTNNEIENRLKKLSVKEPELLNFFKEEDLREQISKEFKKSRVINREIGSKIHIESTEIIEFCKQQIRKDRKVGLSQILLNGPEYEVKKKVSEILNEFDNGEKFDELAKNFSVDPNANINGGRLGLFKPNDLLPEIRDIVKNLEPNKISKLVKTNIGYHLLYIYKEVLPTKINCENLGKEKESEFSNSLYNQKRNSFLGKYMDDLFICANITIKDPQDSGLPDSDFLPNIKKTKVNCQNRRTMILPKKKEKSAPKRRS